MGPKCKKPVKNAFSFFLEDYAQEQRKMGRNISNRIAAEECGPLWKELSDDEKQRYGRMAGAFKESMKANKNFKFTSFGESFEDMEKRLEMKMKKLEDAKKEIINTISNLDSNKLPSHLFYIIHCNYYCKTDDIYVPGEIAICEFSLNDGIRRTFHELINPGRIPIGFAYEAQQNIKEIHGLPYPPYKQGNSDAYGIFKDILLFLEPGMLPDGRYPPLYCLEKNINASESVLRQLMEDVEGDNPFRVFSLCNMFFTLKNKCVENVESVDCVHGFPTLSTAVLELEKDVFCYVPGISCDFHVDAEDKYQNCSLSIVKRYVYVICDHCCQYLNIDIIPGKHSRNDCDVNRGKTMSQIEKVIENRKCVRDKAEKTKSESTYSSLYGGSNVSKWTKITPTSYLLDDGDDDDEDSDPVDSVSVKSEAFSYASVCYGRGRPISNLREENYAENFPSLGRGRGRPV